MGRNLVNYWFDRLNYIRHKTEFKTRMLMNKFFGLLHAIIKIRNSAKTRKLPVLLGRNSFCNLY